MADTHPMVARIQQQMAQASRAVLGTRNNMSPPATITSIGAAAPRDVMLRGDRSAARYQPPGPVVPRGDRLPANSSRQGPSATAVPKPQAKKPSRISNVKLKHWSSYLEGKPLDIPGAVHSAAGQLRTRR